MESDIRACDRLIVALDVDTKKEALSLVAKLDGSVSFFKVGYQLFISQGLAFVEELIQQRKKKVFLDLKMDDVGETIRLAVKNIAASGVEFLTIHGSEATVRAALAGRGDKELPQLLSVTLLSNLDQQDLRELVNNSEITLAGYVQRRAEQALKAGCDGLIASGASVEQLRAAFREQAPLIVTPGIRQHGSGRDDHKRFLTPYEAITAGADYLVVGRPIRDSRDPKEAATAIIYEIERAMAEGRKEKG